MVLKVVCTCPQCICHFVLVDGERVPGKKISSQLRRRHEISAAANRSPDFATKPGPSGVKEFLDEDNDGGYEPGKTQSSRGLWLLFFR
jgi:hypothetical protein